MLIICYVSPAFEHKPPFSTRNHRTSDSRSNRTDEERSGDNERVGTYRRRTEELADLLEEGRGVQQVEALEKEEQHIRLENA